jgi:K+-transporting ATPase ATPase C chain
MLQDIRPAVVMMLLFTLVLGLAYPLAMTGMAGLAFPAQAGGALLKDGAGRVVGSALIAQAFTRPEYLHPRPSAAGNGYDPMSSGGSNLGPLDAKLIDRVKTDAAAIAKANRGAAIPADALTTSASGLDPDISPANAAMQSVRIASARGMAVEQVRAVIEAHSRGRLLGFIGEPVVNVLLVNRDLDGRFPMGHPKAP